MTGSVADASVLKTRLFSFPSVVRDIPLDVRETYSKCKGS
jgi:hypothetical protein